MTFFEQLVAEWYDFQGYFVKSNLRFNKGRAFELDVLAYKPQDQSVVHVETGKDATSKEDLKNKISSKMSLDAGDYEKILKCRVVNVTKRAIYGWAKTPQPKDLLSLNDQCSVEIITLNDFIRETFPELDKLNEEGHGGEERWPLLAAIQWARYVDRA